VLDIFRNTQYTIIKERETKQYKEDEEMFQFKVIGASREIYIKGVSLENAIARYKKELFIAASACEHREENIEISDHYDDGDYHIVKFTYTDAYNGESGSCQIKVERNGYEFQPLPPLTPCLKEIQEKLDAMTL